MIINGELISKYFYATLIIGSSQTLHRITEI